MDDFSNINTLLTIRRATGISGLLLSAFFDVLKFSIKHT